MSAIAMLRVESFIALLVVLVVLVPTIRAFVSARRPFSDHVAGILVFLLLLAIFDVWISTHLSALNSSSAVAEAMTHARRWCVVFAALGTGHLYRRVTR